MFTKILRTSLFASLLLLVSLAFYGRFNPKQDQHIFINTVAQSDANDQYFDDGIAGIDESLDIADLDDDDDSDGSFSSRKKISFENNSCFYLAQNTLPRSCSVQHNKFCSELHFYQLPPSHFISLRVFRV